MGKSRDALFSPPLPHVSLLSLYQPDFCFSKHKAQQLLIMGTLLPLTNQPSPSAKGRVSHHSEQGSHFLMEQVATLASLGK